MYEALNQATTLHPDFFDPIHKGVELDWNKKPVTVYYRDEAPSVTVHENKDVEFYFYAPKASKVEVAGLGGCFGRDKLSLKADGLGGFYKKVSKFPRGMHYYNWYVDDVLIRNPKAGVCYGCFGAVNTFEVPEAEEDFYFVKEVPHGTVSICKYVSSVNGHLNESYVYTPYGYEENNTKNYPVLYLQHGVGENETSWIWQGKLNFILDNLIAAKECQEMIVVMSSGYAFLPEEDPVFYPGDFDHEMVYDIIPYMESHFRIKKGRNNRAMAGLSLGSAQAADTVSRHMDLFSALGVFSGVAMDAVEEVLKNKKDKLECTFLSCGGEEKEILSSQILVEEKMRQAGKNCVQMSYPGYHEWHVWRKCLRDFVKLLFTWKDDACEDVMPYQERLVEQEQLLKQTVEEQMLFFNPVYKQVYFAVDEKGNPAGKYQDIMHGIEIIRPQTAVFSIRAKGAKSVEVDVFDCGKIALNPSDREDGYWTGTMENIEPGFHYVTFEVNGTKVLNQDAPVGYGCFQTMNYIEMPETTFKTYHLKNVPHGKIHMNYYHSTQTEREKLCYVYTPAGYEENIDKNYPVLYLQHGGGENEIGWLRQGKIANIADNLISERKMEEMIIVMNSGYAFCSDGTSHPALGSFDRELIDDCMPFIEKQYRILQGKEHTAMAGLSMGGMQTQKTVFHNLDRFGWAGIFSGSLVVQNEEEDYREILYNPQKLAETFQMLYVACGTEDRFFDETKEHVQDVQNHGVALTVFFNKGRHDWIFWRHCAADFLTKVFQTQKNKMTTDR